MVSRSKLLIYIERKKAASTNWRTQDAIGSLGKTTHDLEDEWKQVLFSDEKKWNLDGPDCAAYYWHDLRKEERIFSKRQERGQSLLIWAGFGYPGQTIIPFPEGRMNATDYQDLL